MSYAVSTFGLMSFDLNSFDDVKKRYEGTKPINSKVNPVSDDIRPIFDRKRKYERIMKFSETCYALLDGDGYADSLTSNWVGEEQRQKCRDNVSETLTFAPVVWTRHDGYDTIRIRNGSGDYAHVSRYSFIARCLPRAMSMTIGQGKQYIWNKNGSGDKQYLLPKSDYYSYRNGVCEEYPEKGHRYLTFEIVHGENVFSIIDGEFVVNPKRTAVNKELKAKYKKGIDSMWEYVCTVAPMFNNVFGRNVAYSEKWQLQHAFHDDAKQEVEQWNLSYMEGRVKSNRHETHLYIQDPATVFGHGREEEKAKYDKLSEREKQMWRIGTRTNIKPHHTELILEDDEHPLKLVLAKEIISDIPELTDCEDKDEAKKLRSRYNRWFNNHLVLVETVAHETITKRYTSQNPATSKGRK